MKLTDLVNLVVLTPNNYIHFPRMSRKLASDNIRGWYELREAILNEDIDKIDRARKVLKEGTLVGNSCYDDGGDFANAIVGYEHVVGMYIQEIPQEGTSIHERQVEAAEKLVALAEKQVDSGEEWKESRDEN